MLSIYNPERKCDSFFIPARTPRLCPRLYPSLPSPSPGTAALNARGVTFTNPATGSPSTWPQKNWPHIWNPQYVKTTSKAWILNPFYDLIQQWIICQATETDTWPPRKTLNSHRSKYSSVFLINKHIIHNVNEVEDLNRRHFQHDDASPKCEYEHFEHWIYTSLLNGTLKHISQIHTLHNQITIAQ